MMTMSELEMELSVPEPWDLGDFSYEFIDLGLLYAKLALMAQGKYEALYWLSDLPYRRRFAELSRNERLFVLSLSKSSPIRIRLGAWIPNAIKALGELMERLYRLPETKERARLDNEARRIEITLSTMERLGLEQIHDSQRIALANELLHDIRRVVDRRKRIRIIDTKIQE